MTTIKDLAYQLLQSDFSNWKIANGFENDIKFVYRRGRVPSQIPDYPSICILFNPDIQKNQLLAEQQEKRILPIILFLHYKCEDENDVENVKSSLQRDFDKMFYRSNTILSNYHTHLKSAGIQTEYNVIAYNDDYVPLTQKYGCIAIEIHLEYYKDSDVIDSYSYSLTAIQQADKRFTLTSNFISATSDLQNQINNISISGANVWGTITGDINNQTDLINKFNEYSLTSSLTAVDPDLFTLTGDFVSSTGFLYNAITGINLSGYSLTSHSHNSFTSLTSNLFQSDNIILPSGASNNLPITFRRAVGTTGYEGFYSIGSGIGVITNYTYANAFMSAGLITKKLHLDGDMWQVDVNLYRKTGNGLALQTNTLDRLVIASGGDISISGTLLSISNITGNNLFANGGYLCGSTNTGGRFLLDIGGIHSYANYSAATFDVNFTGANQKIIFTSPNIQNIGNVSISGNLTATGDVIANSVSLTGHTHSFSSLTDISAVPKTWSVMDGDGLPTDGYKEGDFCIMYTNGGEDNIVYHSTYIAINPSTGLTWQQIN